MLQEFTQMANGPSSDDDVVGGILGDAVNQSMRAVDAMNRAAKAL
jgi:hypothetical protein